MGKARLFPACAAVIAILATYSFPPVVTTVKSYQNVFKDCEYCPEMVVVPAGEFLMGSTSLERRWAIQAGSKADWLKNERHRRLAVIPYKFAVGKFEVTQAEWRAVMGTNPSFFEGDSKPVEFISWNDVQDFLDRLSQITGERYRLLTETEWEYAARADSTTPFSTGQTITSSQANFNGSYTYGGSSQSMSQKETVPVGSFTANKFGLHDMHGNVWEWTADCYDENAYYMSRRNPRIKGETTGACHRVLRGGAFYNAPMNIRSAKRYWIYPIFRSGAIGFRVARDLPQLRLASPRLSAQQ